MNADEVDAALERLTKAYSESLKQHGAHDIKVRTDDSDPTKFHVTFALPIEYISITIDLDELKK